MERCEERRSFSSQTPRHDTHLPTSGELGAELLRSYADFGGDFGVYWRMGLALPSIMLFVCSRGGVG